MPWCCSLGARGGTARGAQQTDPFTTLEQRRARQEFSSPLRSLVGRARVRGVSKKSFHARHAAMGSDVGPVAESRMRLNAVTKAVRTAARMKGGASCGVELGTAALPSCPPHQGKPMPIPGCPTLRAVRRHKREYPPGKRERRPRLHCVAGKWGCRGPGGGGHAGGFVEPWKNARRGPAGVGRAAHHLLTPVLPLLLWRQHTFRAARIEPRQ